MIEADDPKGWHAFVPELPGCHSFGDIPIEAIYMYLLAQKSQNREVKTKDRFVDHISMSIPV